MRINTSLQDPACSDICAVSSIAAILQTGQTAPDSKWPDVKLAAPGPTAGAALVGRAEGAAPSAAVSAAAAAAGGNCRFRARPLSARLLDL